MAHYCIHIHTISDFYWKGKHDSCKSVFNRTSIILLKFMVSRRRSCGVWFSRIKAPDEFRILDITASRRKVQWHSGPKIRPPHHPRTHLRDSVHGPVKDRGPHQKQGPRTGELLVNRFENDRTSTSEAARAWRNLVQEFLERVKTYDLLCME